jgi:hypothetical protein
MALMGNNTSGLFGDSQREAQMGLTAAKGLNSLAKLGGYSNPYIGYGLDLFKIASNPTPENALKTAGGNINSLAKLLTDNYGSAGSALGSSAGSVGGLTASGMTGSEAALAGGDAAAGLGGSAAGLGAGAAMAGLTALFMGMAGQGPLGSLNPTGYSKRQVDRAAQASSMQNSLMQALKAVPTQGKSALDTPMFGSTAGDALANILKYNLNGTFMGTAHNWLPDPSYYGLQKGLNELGYYGNTEPKNGMAGGVGEMIAAAGHTLLPPGWGKERLLNGYELTPSEIANMGGTPTGLVDGYYGPALGARGWEATLRGLLDIPQETPSAVSRLNEWGFNTPAWETNPQGTYGENGMGYTPPVSQRPDEYLASLPPEIARLVESSNYDFNEANRMYREAWSNAP